MLISCQHLFGFHQQYNAKLLYLEPNNQRLLDEMTCVEGVARLPPECLMSGRLGMETDVYTFGVLLLELLNGSKDIAQYLNKRCLDTRTGSLLPDNSKIGEIIDPRLGSNYPVKAATQMGTLIQRCTERKQKKRPLMQPVLDVLNYIAEIKY